jgi:hypothetical protein
MAEVATFAMSEGRFTKATFEVLLANPVDADDSQSSTGIVAVFLAIAGSPEKLTHQLVYILIF